MKHLIAKEHHIHLKRRAILELAGLILLVVISIDQRQLLTGAFEAIYSSNKYYLLLLFGLYWLILPLTAISYRLLALKKIPLRTTTLAQLAGAGPGRVIPGGLGHISIGSSHLQKSGFSLERSLVIAVSNNIIGILANTLLIVLVISGQPKLISRIIDNLSGKFFVASLLVILLILTLGQWLSHVRGTRKIFRNLKKQLRIFSVQLAKHPKNFIGALAVAALVTLGQVAMLLVAGEALQAHLSFTDALLALSMGVIIAGIIPTPGGLGGLEAGTTSALIVLGYDPTAATSLSLLYRTATYWQPLLPGLFAYLYLRRRDLV